MKIRLYFQFILSFCLSVGILAQDLAMLQVLDKQSGQSLPFATIQSGQFSTISNEYGWAEVPKGRTYEVSYLGYGQRQITIDGKQDTFKIYLPEQAKMLEAAVVTGNRRGERYIDAIAPLDIMPAAILRTRATPDLSTLINRMPGIQIVDGQISIRGGAGYAYGAGSRVAVLLNNIPMLQADAGTISWSDLPVELIERIEILKGSAATLYGSAALNGVLQMHTWPFMKDTAITEIMLATRLVGSPRDKQKQWYQAPRVAFWGNLTHKDLKGPFQWQGSLRYEDKESHLKGNFTNRYRMSFMSRYQVNQRMEVGMQSLLNKVEGASFLYWKNPEQGAFIGDSSARIENQVVRFQIDPYIKITTSSGNRHWLQSRIFYSNNHSSNNRGSSLTQYLLQYQYAHNLWEGKALLVSGLTSQAFNSEAELFGNRALWAYNSAVYSKYEHTFFRKLKCTAGVRLEYNGQFPGQIEFQGDSINANTQELQPLLSAGLNYAPFKSTAISVHYGEGYRFPTIAEKFITTTLGPTAIAPNPDLLSEKGYSLNLSIKQGLQVAAWQSIFRLDLFLMKYRNMIEFGLRDLTLGFQALNIGDTDIKGFEFTYMGQFGTQQLGAEYMISYTHIWPEYSMFTEDIAARSSADYNILKYRVRDQLSIQTQLHWKNWTLGVSGLYNSEMEAIDRILELFLVEGLEEYRSEHADGFFRWDVSIGYDFTSLSVMLDIQNIGNIEYTLRPGLIELPRNYNLQLKYRF